MLTTRVKKYILANLAGGLSVSGASFSQGTYLGLSSTTPTAEGANFSEPASSTGYARIKITASTSGEPVYPFEWTDSTYSQVQNKYEVHFNVATASWGTLTYVGIFDASGNLLAYGNLIDSEGTPTSITVEEGHIPTIVKGQAKISIDLN